MYIINILLPLCSKSVAIMVVDFIWQENLIFFLLTTETGSYHLFDISIIKGCMGIKGGDMIGIWQV